MATLPTNIATQNGVKGTFTGNQFSPVTATGGTNSTYTPTVLTSSAASDHLEGTVKPAVADVNNQITTQQAKVTADKAATDLATQTKNQQQADALAAKAKATIDQQNADTKAAAVTAATNPAGGGTTNGVKNDQPYSDVNGNNTNNWRVITNTDGSQQTVTKNTDGSYTPVSSSQITIANNQAQLDKTNTDYQTKADAVTNTINSIANGSIPLSPGEQAQVDGLSQSYKQLIDQQTLANTNASGVANIRGYQTGSAEYDPSFQVKTIGAIVTAGVNKVADLNIKMAGAVADLTQQIKANDIANIKSAWDVYNAAATKRTDALQKTIDTAQKAISDAQAAVEKDNAYKLDVQKFQETKDQNAFDRAFKQEQETETIRHNQATEGGGGGNNITSTTVGPTGNPDPVSQKATYDQIAQQYGPMTAVAIQKLANYEMNPADWRAGAAKGMTRADAVALAEMLDPTYDDKQYATRQAALTNFKSGKYSQNINSLNTAVGHLADVPVNFAKLRNGPMPSANWIGNTVEKAFGAGGITSASSNVNAATGELASTFKSGGATDQEIKNLGTIDSNSSSEQAKAFVQTNINLLGSRLSALSDTYTSAMGKPPGKSFLSDDNIATLSDLKNKGYDIKIPGVYYTDPLVYAKISPDNATKLTEVRRAHPELTSAQATQLAQYQQENGQ